MKKMVEQGDGSFQKAIDDSRCPKCLTVIDYTREFAHCKSCNLTMHGEGIRKEKDPRQLELPLWPMGEHHGTQEKDEV